MSQPRRDRLYPRPRTTLHAWFLEGDGPPRQVLILAWRSHSYKWQARITYSLPVKGDPEPAVIQRWVPMELLRPVKSDPNKAFGIR